jgi:hypothetical protein
MVKLPPTVGAILMNKNQRIVIGFAVIIIVLMALYPPYKVVSLTGRPSQFLGYGFLFDPPHHKVTPVYWELKLNWSRLINQWVLVLIPSLVIWWVLRERKK